MAATARDDETSRLASRRRIADYVSNKGFFVFGREAKENWAPYPSSSKTNDDHDKGNEERESSVDDLPWRKCEDGD